MSRTIKILSIDGGGIRGIIPSLLLCEIEKRTNRRIAEMFDLIAGTSTGGLIALGLTVPGIDGKPNFSAQDLANFYEYNGNIVFAPTPIQKFFPTFNLFKPKFQTEPFENLMKVFFGDSCLSDSVTDVLITAYEIESRQAFFFKSNRIKKGEKEDFKMRDVARATTSAPTYYPPASISPNDNPKKEYYFIDGGVFANNPAMCAYSEAKNMLSKSENVLVASLGTGTYSSPIFYNQAKNWGTIQWAVPLLLSIFDGQPDTVEYQMRRLLPDTNNVKSYYRFQVEIDKDFDTFDNATSTNIKMLKHYAENLIRDKDIEINNLCKQLLF